jgi:DNA-binding MarR family transcriptional regulator
MDPCIPLPALLSSALVAFTIEFDNEAEHRLPHRTTNHGSTGEVHAPWLVSLVMWMNCMRFVDEKGVTIRDLERLARTETNLSGMERWGYVSVAPDESTAGKKQPRSAWVIRAKRGGMKAREVWRPLMSVIEERWRERFGVREIDRLRNSLWANVKQFELDLPDCLPILGYGLASREKYKQRQADPGEEKADAIALPSLLSKVLLAFTLEFESKSDVSLAICANVLRLVDKQGVRVRDLPRLAGVSTEGIAMALSFLAKQGFAAVKPESSGSRVKLLLLTAKGERERKKYIDLLADIEERWQSQFGETIHELRNCLESLAGGMTATSPLFRGLQPYPEGWRAALPKPEALPHYPMVLHRGGYPDGS